MERTDIIIIGAGIVGLSIAARISRPDRSIYVLEKHRSFGQEVSSRNSEVIHTGIYYEPDSLKAKTCIEGNRMLYDICIRNKIPFRKTGKLIVATEKNEESSIVDLLNRGERNGVEGIELLSRKEIKILEPNIKSRMALFSPLAGIVDTYSLMLYFIRTLKSKGGDIVYNSSVVNMFLKSGGYEVIIEDGNGGNFKIQTQVVINSAGLNSDKIAEMIGIDIENAKYELKYCKGQYFRINNTYKCRLINHLIYPVPERGKGGLGIHATLDLSNSVRLGPDDHYIDRDKINYEVDISERRNFYNSVVDFLPFLEEEDLIPDLAGVRPKLHGENEDFRDFVIKEESDLGFPGFINLIGIESPGLTSSLAIAKYVDDILKKTI